MKYSNPAIKAVMSRRYLLNYRLHPAVATLLVPHPFQPKIIRDWALAGVCLMELKQLRPAGLPPWTGLHSIHAAHRIAVTWKETEHEQQGVYIPIRHTNSRLAALAGGRLFPGVQKKLNVVEWDPGEPFKIELRDAQDEPLIKLSGKATREWTSRSLFDSFRDASEFFRNGTLGWSPSLQGCEFEGVELHASSWPMNPLDVDCLASSFFDDKGRFPDGTVFFDNALIMENLEHEWHALDRKNLWTGKSSPARHGPSGIFRMP